MSVIIYGRHDDDAVFEDDNGPPPQTHTRQRPDRVTAHWSGHLLKEYRMELTFEPRNRRRNGGTR